MYILLRRLGQRLQRRKEELGLSRLELARRAGLDPETVRRVEQGKDAKLGTWLKLARALEQPLEELLAGLELEQTLKAEVDVEMLYEMPETDQKLLRFLKHYRGGVAATAPQLARALGCSERAVWDAIKRQDGLRIEVQRRKGRDKPNTYRLKESLGNRDKGGGKVR